MEHSLTTASKISDESHLTRFKHRYSAAFAHLLVSLVITTIVIGISVWLWYPIEFISATGVTQIFILVILVDTCLGPILTLFVYDKSKKGLKRDLVTIFVIQFCALVYGVSTLADARTVYVVFAVDRFELVQANDLSPENLALAKEDKYQELSWFGPKWISTSLPDPSESMTTAIGAVGGGADIAQMPRLYRELSEVTADILDRVKPLTELEPDSEASKIHLSEIKVHAKQTGTPIGFLPLTARKKSLSVIIDTNSARVIDIVDIDPW